MMQMADLELEELRAEIHKRVTGISECRNSIAMHMKAIDAIREQEKKLVAEFDALQNRQKALVHRQ